MDTDLQLAVSQNVHVITSGWAQYGPQTGNDCGGYPLTDPDGNRVVNATPCSPEACGFSDCLVVGAPVGELLVRIGAQAWVPAGSDSTFTAQSSGDLWLAYNDSYFSDNSGRYMSTVTVTTP